MNELSELLKLLRGKESLRSVSRRAGISHNYLSILERGYDPQTEQPINPTPQILKKLSEAYKYPYDILMEKAGLYGGFLKDQMALDNIIISKLSALSDDGRFHNYIIEDIFTIFSGFIENVNIQSFDEEFKEYLDFEGDRPDNLQFDDEITISRFHSFYNLKSTVEVIVENPDLEWKEQLINELDELLYKYGLQHKISSRLKNEIKLVENKEIDIEDLINSKLTYKGYVLTEEQKELYIKMARALLE
jgi:transcriptional regulator with XRE-family HTH domain